ncbi:hypothetical protein BDN67DRAFT_1005512 [Paxillus ammoniavirescens]|nr:hypothetical protein BDN67DRAFT_1005512 [Paxillus ammoniavirescens]
MWGLSSWWRSWKESYINAVKSTRKERAHFKKIRLSHNRVWFNDQESQGCHAPVRNPQKVDPFGIWHVDISIRVVHQSFAELSSSMKLDRMHMWALDSPNPSLVTLGIVKERGDSSGGG